MWCHTSEDWGNCGPDCIASSDTLILGTSSYKIIMPGGFPMRYLKTSFPGDPHKFCDPGN